MGSVCIASLICIDHASFKAEDAADLTDNESRRKRVMRCRAAASLSWNTRQGVLTAKAILGFVGLQLQAQQVDHCSF